MSVDINWSLLNTPCDSSTSTGNSNPIPSTSRNSSGQYSNTEEYEEITNELSESLIILLNEQLQTSKRPSFIGPITVTSFSFGDLGPDLEIKDIRDVWRVFDQGDEEGDELQEKLEKEELIKKVKEDERHRIEKMGVESELDEENYEYINKDFLNKNKNENENENQLLSRGKDSNEHSNSIKYKKPGISHKSISNSNNLITERERSKSGSTINSGKSYIPFHFDPNSSSLNINSNSNSNIYEGLKNNSSSLLFSPGLGRRSNSIASFPRQTTQSILGRNDLNQNLIKELNNNQEETIDTKQNHNQDEIELNLSNSSSSSPPAQISNKISNESSIRKNSKMNLPSIQLHLNLNFKSNLNLTFITSLQVNYPSNLFMSLPLKINITGFEIKNEIILAYSNEKNRLHLTLLNQEFSNNDNNNNNNEEDENEFENDLNFKGEKNLRRNSIFNNNNNNNNDYEKIPIGMKILKNLQIESEIGHSDVHVLRNVGKVERFIVDVIRKTLVEELVFPNFHTIVL
ncbi:uncharacterized protein I206_101543 [Kwoniella pini CBS 10737]|uniref:Mitochondrial distribution and morphology protein 12 n=1 Tax=Kwoniella pini CBS 10737 TaxID=1296096 RepID=A0A1B9HWD9_9TREE|nr:uncharacterized protein I206_06484 [Kwoniella pini CBS 10737]OCF47581.1 hypothetical protein I206_06484 [Kwoniella pini CBS 10737]